MSYQHELRSNTPGRAIGGADFLDVEGAVGRLESDGVSLEFADGVALRLFVTDGRWWAERLSDAEIARLVRVAAAVDAVVVGDERESYALVDGRVVETPATPPARRGAIQRFIASTHPISLIVIALGVVALVVGFVRRVLN